MGSTFCSQDTTTTELSQNPYVYCFDQDKNQTNIIHSDTNICKVKEIQHNIQDCEQKLKKSQRLFKDPTMRTQPILLRSLSSGQSQVKCTYERPYVFLNDPSTGRSKKYKIFDFADCKSTQVIVRDQILQYFGVFLCFLAQNPQLINQIIATESNTYGICVVKMNIGTKKQFIYIDDYILCCDRKPLFSQPVKGIYMWPCLLEKAWFKVKGNIAKKIQKTQPQEVFNSFLSYPMKPYVLRDNQDQYNLTLIKNNIYHIQSQKGCVITTKKQPLHKLGISGRKYFYLVKAFQFKGKELYYLRNPCYGALDFRGSNRIISQQLGAKLKEITGELRVPEGNFVLDELEFLEQVQQFFIVHFSKSSSIISQESLTLEQNQEFFIHTEIKNKGLVSICFNQNEKQAIEAGFSPLTYQVISLADNKIVSDLKNLEGCFGVRNTYLLQDVFEQLPAGQYLIRLKKKRAAKKIKKEQNVEDKIIVTAPFRVKFDYKQTAGLEQKFKNFLISMGKKQLQSKKDQVKRSKQDFQHKGFWLGDLVVIYVEKTNVQKNQIRVEVQFAETKNLECLTHNIKNDFVAIDPFAENLLIIFEKVDLTAQTVLGKYVIQSY